MKDFVLPIDDRDLGTPPSRAETSVTLTIDGFDVTVPEGTSVMRASALAGIAVPKLCATDSMEAFGSCRLCVVEIEGRRGLPASCTTPVAEGMVVRTQSEKVRRLRKGVMELYLSDYPTDFLTSSANGGTELQEMAGVVGLREIRYEPGDNHVSPQPERRGEPAPSPEGRQQPLFRLRPGQVHRLLALRARLRRGAGHLRADDRRPRLRQRRLGRDGGRRLPLVGLRELRRLRAGLPDRGAAGEVDHRARRADPLGPHHLRLLRRRLLVQGRAERRPGGADDAVQARQGQPRPLLRQGPLRLRLRQPQGPDPEADDPRLDRRAVEGGRVGRGDRLRGREAPRPAGDLRAQVDRRPHLEPLHQRGDLPRAEARPRGLRQQQHRHLRPGLPLADRLRPRPDLRHLGRHPGLRLGREGGRDRRHRRQPDRRPPGLRLADEAAAARGREARSSSTRAGSTS